MDSNSIILYILIAILFSVAIFRKKIAKINKKLMLFIDLFVLFFIGILFVIRAPGYVTKVFIIILILILIFIKIFKYNKKDIFSDNK